MSEQEAPRAKPVILVFVRYYLPGFRSGGPVRSVSNLVRALDGEYDFRIVCLNRDHGETVPYAHVTPGRWTRLGEARVYYVTDHEAGFSLCRRMVREVRPDMVYLNSLLDREFSMKSFLAAGRGRGIPVLLAPRGELSPGALGMKAKRKQLFLTLVRTSRYYAHLNWHASSVAEEERIHQVFAPPTSRVFLASNLPEMPQGSVLRTQAKQAGALKIVLAARISPMKNTLAAIRMVGQLEGEVELDLWGPLEDREYWAACQQQMLLCRPNVKVRYRGEVAHEQLHVLLHGYDVMLLPTFGENFGHSIIEALSAGLPVVISDRTPWQGLMDVGVGADVPLDNEPEFVRQLERFREMSESEMQDVRAACGRYVAAWHADNANLDAYRKMFDTVIASRTTSCK
jgi:glycosyltransferase involved in cell wall biosynthesis